MRFQIGDLVRCIDAGEYRLIKNGEIYTVLYVDHDSGSIGLTSSEKSEWFPTRFELVERKNPPLDNQEYEDILAGNEIYSKLVDG